MRAVVIAGNGQNTAMLMGAGHVGAMQRVAGAVYAGTLAVPHAVHAIDPLAGEGIELLRAVKHRGG